MVPIGGSGCSGVPIQRGVGVVPVETAQVLDRRVPLGEPLATRPLVIVSERGKNMYNKYQKQTITFGYE